MHWRWAMVLGALFTVGGCAAPEEPPADPVPSGYQRVMLLPGETVVVGEPPGLDPSAYPMPRTGPWLRLLMVDPPRDRVLLAPVDPRTGDTGSAAWVSVDEPVPWTDSFPPARVVGVEGDTAQMEVPVASR